MESYSHSCSLGAYLHFMTSLASVYIPRGLTRGLIHCPLSFKTVNEPIVIVHTTIAPAYARESKPIIKG
jgi:hypothetical protein